MKIDEICCGMDVDDAVRQTRVGHQIVVFFQFGNYTFFAGLIFNLSVNQNTFFQPTGIPILIYNIDIREGAKNHKMVSCN